MKRLLSAILWLALLAPLAAQTPTPPRVLIMLPDNFMWPEYAVPAALYKGVGFQVTVATPDGRPAHPDTRNYDEYEGVAPVEADLAFGAVKVEEYDAVTTVGGNGAWEAFMPNPVAHSIILTSLRQGKTTALICASTGVLAMLNNFDGQSEPVVKGRRVTGYYKVEGLLRKIGEVDFVAGDPKEVTVVVDGNLVTGRNPESSRAFGETVVKRLLK